ncbi:hypothetical protein PZB75_29905 [Streptomyces sp. AM 4-1-1]|uniref:hypothetical protein n=1 Tax=unclassified Streptomyces TaxID=2593676 RepID=UPI0023BA06AE|nr:hypothetical protein [Streptomyces sp. AM 4-1-1]WEH37211.1 hypothetical protein PZB75_29905 [Streptomyces sp. AM 4-1-1]
MADVLDAQSSVVLTASPLQRVGAFALAALAEVGHPEAVTGVTFAKVTDEMTRDLVATAGVAKASDPGGFWLGASYMLWPNSKINPTARARQAPEERERLVRGWRSLPDEDRWPDAPCAYCGRAACGWFGKVDIPLGASVEHRNTTAPGHQGTPLCYPCVVSLWAFPYGASLSGGRAAAIHSWDDDFLAAVTSAAVDRSRRAAVAGVPAKKAKPIPYAREAAVLSAVRAYGYRIASGVELLVLSNGNKEQFLVAQELDQPVAEWLRSTQRRPEHRTGYPLLVASQAAKQVPGESFLAKRVFARPAQVLDFVVGHLLTQISATAPVPAQTPVLAPLVYSYCREVLTMDDKDVERIEELARRLAALLGQDSRPGPFRDFIRANSKGGNLPGWFRSRGVEWLLLPRPEGTAAVLLPVRDYRLLFEGERAWSWRRLLVFAVLEALANDGWQPKGSQSELQEIKDELTDAVSADNEEEVER